MRTRLKTPTDMTPEEENIVNDLYEKGFEHVEIVVYKKDNSRCIQAWGHPSKMTVQIPLAPWQGSSAEDGGR